HEDRGGVGAAGIEGAMAQRDLAVEAGQNVQAQNRDGIDHHHVELVHPVVLDQEGQYQQGEEQRDGTQPDPFAVYRFHTRVTTREPNSPSGRSVRTATINTSANGSLRSLPMT